MFDWTAIGSIAAILGVIVAVLTLQSQKSGFRPRALAVQKRVIFSHVEFNTQLPTRVRGTEHSLFLTAERLQFKNISARNISNVAIRLTPRRKVWSAHVERTKRLAKEAVAVEILENSIRISMHDFPADEEVEVIVFSNEVWMRHDSVRSENANIDLVKKD